MSRSWEPPFLLRMDGRTPSHRNTGRSRLHTPSHPTHTAFTRAPHPPRTPGRGREPNERTRRIQCPSARSEEGEVIARIKPALVATSLAKGADQGVACHPCDIA